MIRAFRAELRRLRRRRVFAVTAAASIVFAAVGALVVLVSAEPAATNRGGRGPTLEALATAGGGTEVFTTAVSFAGTFLFVVFAGAIAAEFSRGTIRTMLLRQPSRVRLLAGKMAGLIAFSAAVLAGTEALTWVAARLLAPSQNLDAGQWVSMAGVGAGIVDYAAVLVWVSGYALLALALAVLVRSVPLTLAIGIAWAGPFEHLLQDAWAPASRIFPGLLLEAFAAGGTSEVTVGAALVGVIGYGAVAALVAGTDFSRRDVAG